MLRQLAGIEAHQIALEFLKVPLQQSGRGLAEDAEHARGREDGQAVDRVLFRFSPEPIDDLSPEASLLLLDVMCHAVLAHRPRVFGLRQRILKPAMLINMLRALLGQAAAQEPTMLRVRESEPGVNLSSDISQITLPGYAARPCSAIVQPPLFVPKQGNPGLVKRWRVSRLEPRPTRVVGGRRPMTTPPSCTTALGDCLGLRRRLECDGR